jgi:leucyl-tRNA synthetase
MPVDQYIGGIEHAILHLLYSRFWSKVMRDLGLVSYDEPFTRLLTQGMVLNHIFSRRTEKGALRYFAPDEVELRYDAAGRVAGASSRADGAPVDYQGVGTMSKSKRNGVDPQRLIEEYGADTARFFMMFASPPEQTLEWSDSGVDGSYRFLKRVWGYGAQFGRDVRPRLDATGIAGAALSAELAAARRDIHANLRQANYDMQRLQFNTVASAAMKILNTLERAPGAPSREHAAVASEGLSILLRLLSPITPHVCQVLWSELGYGEDILAAPWPEPLEEALAQAEIELVLQVAGKTRGKLRVPAAAGQAEIERLALASETAAKYMEGRPARKVVVVPGRLVNIVV